MPPEDKERKFKDFENEAKRLQDGFRTQMDEILERIRQRKIREKLKAIKEYLQE